MRKLTNERQKRAKQTIPVINDSVNTLKTESRVLAFIFFFCSLVTNKYLLAALYSTYGLKTTWVSGVIWLHTAFWVIAGILAWTNLFEQRRGLTNALFGAAISIVFFQMLVLVDRTLLPLVTNMNEERVAGLIFEPHSRVRYKTSEFDVIAEINSLGIRDHEYSLTKKSRYRVLTFGDSFTFGWGVDIDSSWPKVLERKLKAEGVDVEVLNCGKTGGTTTTYRECAEKAVPALKPNLIIVGLYQGNDIMDKIYEIVLRRPSTVSYGFDIIGFVQRLPGIAFKNSLALLREKLTSQVLSTHAAWLEESRKIRLWWGGRSKVRYALLSDSLRTMFESGYLNPGVIEDDVEFPDMLSVQMDTRIPVTMQAIAGMEADLKAIKSVCDVQGTDLMLISIPSDAFVSLRAAKAREMALTVTDEMLSRGTIDSVYRSFANHLGVSFLGFTDLFRQRSQSAKLYYRYDGHFTPSGHSLLGDSLGSFLMKNYFKETSKVN